MIEKRKAPPHPLDRPAIKRLRARATHIVAAFLRKQAPKLIGQIVVLRGKMLMKGTWSQDQQDQFDRIISGIDFVGWAVLAGDIDDTLEEIFKLGASEAMAYVGIGVDAKAGALEFANADAIDYARERGAEMVGMRRDELGRLHTNPRAEYAITDATRDMIRGDVREALEEGVSNDVLSTRLLKAYAFSDSRAMVIARTETIRASNHGSLAAYKASNAVGLKEWVTAEDDKVSEDCQDNGDAGPIPLDSEFPSGDDAPPAHPNCRCVIVPVVSFEGRETEEQES